MEKRVEMILGDVVSGGATIEKIGHGDTASTQTYNIASAIPKYKELTEDNFMLKIVGTYLNGNDTTTVYNPISYNANTGDVTVGKIIQFGGGATGTKYGVYLSYDLYCVY